LELIPIERLRMQLEVNLIGQVAVTQAFVPFLRQTKGRVVNMGSISGRVASPMIGPYAMSKFGLEAFSDSLRRELHPWGIQVSIVEPGAIATPIWDKSIDRVDHVLKVMTEEAKRLYGESIETARKTARKASEEAIPAVYVAKAVHHALTAPKPRTRYLVGKEAKIAARVAWILPDRAMDWIIRKSRGR
jgi:NAD(P)-dependent dehydrogenase (short-subunit alcohol dehydrogenase family)